VGQKRIRSVEELEAAARSAAHKSIALLIQRESAQIYLPVPVP
jgi:hypothetical protein